LGRGLWELRELGLRGGERTLGRFRLDATDDEELEAVKEAV